MNNKNIYLIIGGSGSGKTVIQEMLHKQHNLIPVISYTTRPPRYEGESNHIFISDEEFDSLKNIVAYTEYCGHRYCATAEQVDKSDTYVIDLDGIEYFKKAYRGNKGVKIIYINSPVHTRKNRMEKRGDDYGLVIERLINDSMPLREIAEKADFTVFNNDNTVLSDIVNDIWKYIRKEENSDG